MRALWQEQTAVASSGRCQSAVPTHSWHKLKEQTLFVQLFMLANGRVFWW